VENESTTGPGSQRDEAEELGLPLHYN